ncbi:nuclear transport factor 2 family protein [Bradyrhizobium sp. 2TAF24]|uniref:nuclear transport factor 2 family protein n=1 Tax=Bradyrhizobium sp. 2TAF24 TaxID=3233011 RepID=UPI003F8F895C
MVTNTERFVSQRQAFEQTYLDDDWTRLAPYFHDDVRYEVMNMPFHCVVERRDAVFAAMRRSVARFDRLCTRTLGYDATLLEEGDNVFVYGAIKYRRGDSPEMEVRLWEVATYRDGRIVRLIDLYDLGARAVYQSWMAAWGDGLDPSYL